MFYWMLNKDNTKSFYSKHEHTFLFNTTFKNSIPNTITQKYGHHIGTQQ